jgi:hypothetical protein
MIARQLDQVGDRGPRPFGVIVPLIWRETVKVCLEVHDAEISRPLITRL